MNLKPYQLLKDYAIFLGAPSTIGYVQAYKFVKVMHAFSDRPRHRLVMDFLGGFNPNEMREGVAAYGIVLKKFCSLIKFGTKVTTSTGTRSVVCTVWFFRQDSDGLLKQDFFSLIARIET